MELELLIDAAGTAEWRRSRAKCFPDDPRNCEAADLLERLSTELPELEGSLMHRMLLGYWKTRDDFGEEVSAVLRRIGFREHPANAYELVALVLTHFQTLDAICGAYKRVVA
jgi:hypothetical protein